MKKKIVLMLTVIMLIGLAGCGKNHINIKETGTSDNNEQMVQNIYENKRTEVKQKISEIKERLPETSAEDKGTCGSKAKWYYKDNTLIIYGEGVITEDTWHKSNIVINTVVIDSGITKLGNNMFSGLGSEVGKNIENFYIADGLEEIGSSTFVNCDCLSEIVLPPSLYFIDGYTFASCDSLKKIYMTDGVEKIGDSAFTGCKSLESIFIPKTVRAIGNGVFTGCNNLSDIQISKDNRIFSEKNNCINNNDTKTLIYAINKDFSIPDDILCIAEDAFYGCEIDSLVIPEGVKEIEERAFTYSKFAEIKLPDTLKIIGNYAFENCSKLKSVYIPKSVNYIGNNIFHGCSVLEHIEVDNDNTVYDSRKSCNAIIETSRDKMIAACTNTLITDDVVDIANGIFAGFSVFTDTYNKANQINPDSFKYY